MSKPNFQIEPRKTNGSQDQIRFIQRGTLRTQLILFSQKAQVIVVYPSPSDKNAITITEKDIEVLEPLEYLNDTVIEFYLK